jgi:hypothetical protein
VVIEHASWAGPSTITAVPLTALQYDDQHPEWGPGGVDPAAWWSRLGGGDPTEWPRLPAPPAAPLEPAYRDRLREFGETVHWRMPQLLGRERELAEIAAFATGQDSYRWLVGGAYTGRSALMYEAVTVGLPDDTKWVHERSGQADERSVVSGARRGSRRGAVPPDGRLRCCHRRDHRVGTFPVSESSRQVSGAIGRAAMAGERAITIDLGDDDKLVVVAEQIGPALVADEDIVAKLEKVTGSIEKVSRGVLDALRRVEPNKATVELSFSLAIEAGQLVALFGKGKGEASITATLEWSKSSGASSTK